VTKDRSNIILSFIKRADTTISVDMIDLILLDPFILLNQS